MKRRRVVRSSSAAVAVGATLVTLALTVTSVATAGPAGVAPAKTIPTLPPSGGVVTTVGPTTTGLEVVGPGDPTTTSAGSSVSCLGPTQPLTTTADEGATSEAAASGSSESGATVPGASEPGDPAVVLPARAPLSQVIALSAAVLANTDDVARSVGPFATMPTGIATPPIGASVVSFDVAYAPDTDHPADSHYDAEVTFTSPATPADLVAFYRATLASTGLELTGDDRTTSDEGEARELAYDNPDSEYDGADVVVTVIDAADRAGDVVRLAVSDHLDPTVILGLTGWSAGLPGLDTGRPIAGTVGAELSESRVLRVSLSTTYSFAGGDPESLRSQMLSLLPVCGFFLDTPTPTVTNGDATVVHLVHNLLRDLTATFAPGTGDGATVTVAGSITV